MKTNNELIEDFYVGQGGKPHMKEDISFYESDWSMLIPVVEKIEDMDEVYEVIIVLHITEISFTDKGIPDIIANTKSKIKSTYKAVVEFIKFYNGQKYLIKKK